MRLFHILFAAMNLSITRGDLRHQSVPVHHRRMHRQPSAMYVLTSESGGPSFCVCIPSPFAWYFETAIELSPLVYCRRRRPRLAMMACIHPTPLHLLSCQQTCTRTVFRKYLHIYNVQGLKIVERRREGPLASCSPCSLSASSSRATLSSRHK